MEPEEAEYEIGAHWLNDETIDNCCQTVIDMCTSDEGIDSTSVLFVSSLAVSAALTRLDVTKASQKNVRRTLGILEKKNMWPPRDLACFSINSGAHWSLLTYFPGHSKNRIYHYDSGRHFPGRGNTDYAVRVVQMLARIRLVPASIQFVNETGFPIQEGGVECGYYLVAAMANLLHCRRSNLNRGRLVSPINSYNLDLLHRYDLTKLQEIVSTLLFKRNQTLRNYYWSASKKNKNTKPKKKSQQQQIIFSTGKNSAPFSFDDDDDGYESPSNTTTTTKRKRKHTK